MNARDIYLCFFAVPKSDRLRMRQLVLEKMALSLRRLFFIHD